jgi:hypothetical protein
MVSSKSTSTKSLSVSKKEALVKQFDPFFKSKPTKSSIVSKRTVSSSKGKWLAVIDKKSGDTYWWDKDTNKTTWTKPNGKREDEDDDKDENETGDVSDIKEVEYSIDKENEDLTERDTILNSNKNVLRPNMSIWQNQPPKAKRIAVLEKRIKHSRPQLSKTEIAILANYYVAIETEFDTSIATQEEIRKRHPKSILSNSPSVFESMLETHNTEDMLNTKYTETLDLSALAWMAAAKRSQYVDTVYNQEELWKCMAEKKVEQNKAWYEKFK